MEIILRTKQKWNSLKKNWIKMMKSRKKKKIQFQQNSSLNIPLVEMKQIVFKLQQLHVQLH